jgi:hypothetical protein
MKTHFKQDHYETDVTLECKNCYVLQTDTQWTFLRVEQSVLDRLEEIKREINNIVNRNKEFYCDCKKIIKIKTSFEETIKVKTNDFLLNCFKPVSIKLLLNRINVGKSSYGPELKIVEFQENENVIFNSFLENGEESDNEDEINFLFENYNFTKTRLKNKNKFKNNKDGK